LHTKSNEKELASVLKKGVDNEDLNELHKTIINSDSEESAIDFEALKSKDFMSRKESNLLPNRKLKAFYQRHLEESEVSVFTMAENVT